MKKQPIEINRAEREGTGLTLILFSIASTEKKSHKSLARLRQNLAYFIKEALRPFEAFYLFQQQGFVMVLPHTSIKQAAINAKQILDKLDHLNNNKRIQLGLASLNVGDTAETLIDSAKQDCSHV